MYTDKIPPDVDFCWIIRGTFDLRHSLDRKAEGKARHIEPDFTLSSLRSQMHIQTDSLLGYSMQYHNCSSISQEYHSVTKDTIHCCPCDTKTHCDPHVGKSFRADGPNSTQIIPCSSQS